MSIRSRRLQRILVLWIRVTIDLSATSGVITFCAFSDYIVKVEVDVRELEDFRSLDPGLNI